MCNALVTVAHNREGSDYRVDLYFDDGGVWPAEPVASCVLPCDLNVGSVPDVLAGDSIADAIRGHVDANPESAEFDMIGAYLGRLLLRDEVKRRWEQTAVEKTLLHFDPPALRLLPWELMSSGINLFVKKSFMRVRDRDLDKDDITLWPPVKVLVVVGERDDDIGTDIEIGAIKKGLAAADGRIEAEFLFMPTEPELRRVYARVAPHVLHFIGHGDRKPGSREPALRVKAPGRSWLLTAKYVRNLLDRAPRVAILNACRSGQVEDVRALTDAFLDIGTAAVVGMQGDIRGQAAALFGGEFYSALASEESIDTAVTRARTAIYAETGYTDGARDWILPSLTLRVAPERVLAVAAAPEDARRVENQFKEWILAFVNRTEERHDLVAKVDPESKDEKPAKLLLVVGETEAGKTSLLHWLRRRCALRGRRVRYVDFGTSENLDYLQALYAIRDQKEDVPSLAPGAAAAFDRFNYDLGFFARGYLPEDRLGDLPQLDEPPRPRTLGDGPVRMIERLFLSFRDALSQATADSPMILILDHLGGIPASDFQKRLYPLLIRDIVDDHVPNLRLVVALTTEQVSTYWPQEGDEVRVPVKLIERERFEELAGDVVLAMGKPMDNTGQQLVKAVTGYLPDSGLWSPTLLGLVAEIVKRSASR